MKIGMTKQIRQTFNLEVRNGDDRCDEIFQIFAQKIALIAFLSLGGAEGYSNVQS